MKKSLALALVLGIAGPGLLSAGEVAGVRMPDTVLVEGKTLQLNGMGLRTRFSFKVYVAGLYLETPAHDRVAVITPDQIKRVELSIQRKLSGAQVSEAIEEGFEKNSKAQLPTLKMRLDHLMSLFPDVDTGDSIVLTYVPGKGTTVFARLQEKGTIEGKDFNDALLSVWLGPKPVQDSLKLRLLGQQD